MTKIFGSFFDGAMSLLTIMSDAPPKAGEFHEGKLWFNRKGKSLTLGLTSLGVELIGQIEDVELPDEGEDFEKGDTVVTISGSKGSIELIAPATGVIEEINATAKAEPDVVNEDPLEEGWLVKLQIEDVSDLLETAEA